MAEVEAYQRQLAFTGVLNFFLNPKPGESMYMLSDKMGLLGTDKQINTPFKATLQSHITYDLIPILMKKAFGTERSYPEYSTH